MNWRRRLDSRRNRQAGAGCTAGCFGKKARSVTEQHRKAERTAKLENTKKLLKNYRKLKWSIECGTEHTLKLLADNEYQRLMEMEESVQNQRLRSTAMLTAGNRVLWARLNAALDCFKELPQPAAAAAVPAHLRTV